MKFAGQVRRALGWARKQPEPVPQRRVMRDFFIEIDTRCNARCFYCDTGNKSRAPHRKSMEVETFARVIDHALAIGVADQTTRFYLFDRGEPTLHPDLSAILRILDARGLRSSISTNCALVPKLDKDVSLRLMDKLVLSMPGFSQASYDRIHRLPFEKVLANIERMLKEFADLGYVGETILSLHVYRFNEHELKPAADFCRSLGIVYAPYYAYFNDAKMQWAFARGTLDAATLARADDELCLDKLRHQLAQSPPDYHCPQWENIAINERGDLLLCCGAPRVGDTYDPGFLLGSFLDMSAEDIARAKTPGSVCRDCNANGISYLCNNIIRPEALLRGEL